MAPRRTVGRSQRWTDRVDGRSGYGFGVSDVTLWFGPYISASPPLVLNLL